VAGQAMADLQQLVCHRQGQTVHKEAVAVVR